MVIALGTAFLDKPSPSRDTWRYDQLISQVESGKVETVRISADRSKAIAIAQDGRQVEVNLPNDPQLINLLNNNGVDISVLPQ
ncbi:MAG: cell division protein FtsH, partial [Moorea sp. SIO4E2]|nr:cell division protein FtsH [Moorena sp. SIO4E2]